MRKLWKWILLFVLLFTLCCGIAAADGSGTCGADGENVVWTLDDGGTLTISGTGAMYDYANSGSRPPWRWNSNEIYNVVIEDGVTHIGSDAFWFCNNFEFIEIPASVTSIGQSAFANCTSMTEVDYSGSRSGWKEISITGTGNEFLLAAKIVCAIPDEGRISASYDAVSGCLTVSGTGAMPQYQLYWNSGFYAHDAPWSEYHESIRSIVIESGITSISEGAFSGCSGLTEVTIPDSVTEIGSYAFCGCSSLTGVTIPDGVISIRSETFSGCINLASVVLPENLLLIDYGAFMNCSGLAGIEFPPTLTAIRHQAFNDCSGLTGITLPENLKCIGSVAFAGCSLAEIRVAGSTRTAHFFYADEDGNHLYHIDLPAGLTDIDPSAFFNNRLPYDIPDFVLPPDLTVIEAETFCGTDARFVWLPEGITSIGANAFASSHVQYVYIPYDCDSIGEGAFPAGTILLGTFNRDWEAGYARTWAEQNDCGFILLEDPYGGNG